LDQQQTVHFKTTDDVQRKCRVRLCFLLIITSDMIAVYFSAPEATHKGINN